MFLFVTREPTTRPYPGAQHTHGRDIEIGDHDSGCADERKRETDDPDGQDTTAAQTCCRLILWHTLPRAGQAGGVLHDIIQQQYNTRCTPNIIGACVWYRGRAVGPVARRCGSCCAAALLHCCGYCSIYNTKYIYTYEVCKCRISGTCIFLVVYMYNSSVAMYHTAAESHGHGDYCCRGGSTVLGGAAMKQVYTGITAVLSVSRY